MTPPNATYEQLHLTSTWAYGEQPDRQLVDALAAISPGRAVDLGGGQGRHALYLASQGFDVELVDFSQEALAQAELAAVARGLVLQTVRSNIAFYDPPPRLQVVVAALMFQVPARHASLATAAALGGGLNSGGLLYLSLPGFDDRTRALALDILQAAGCDAWVEKHVVTRRERPRLPVPRRNETRAVGIRR